MTNNSVDKLGTEPIGKLLFKLAVPTVTAQIINMLYNVVDRIFIGHIPEIGTTALTGVGVCLPLIMIVAAFSSVVSSGSAPRASIRLGEGKREDAELILGNSFTTQIIISVILTAILLIFNRPLLLAFGASSDTIGYAVRYMNIYAIGTIFVQVTLGLNAFISAQGFTQISMFTVLIGAICNIGLDWLFIYGLNMDVRGAALATVISQGISGTLAFLFLIGKKTNLKLKVSNLAL
ncbi:MAG: polysaccharide biosynthesis C-terminal domain-containing protein, partial [Clostridia bacterium]|nr:polysaccharide biosynthesis C-terminal domain-containing protein [Clostridia bacterium]